MSKKTKWMIVALLLVPVAAGLCILVYDAITGGAIIPAGKSSRIGLVRVDGTIYSSQKQVEQLREYCDDRSIAGVLLRINSPGGGVAASQEMYREVLRFQQKNKPLVVSMESVAASGGYYIASPALRIFANAGTITGSIGVIFQFSRFYKLLAKLGIEMETLTAGRLKDVGSPYRELTTAERSFLKDLLDDFHTQFIDDVCRARPLICDSLARISDGRIMTGRQALRAGLVDTLGNSEDALDYLKELTGLAGDAPVVEKKPRLPWLRTLLSENARETAAAIRSAVCPSGVYYLYDAFSFGPAQK